MFLILFMFALSTLASAEQPLTFIGSLKTVQHGVRGDVYASDHHTIVIENFHYNGMGEDAVFWAGESSNLEHMMDTVILSSDGNHYTFFDAEAPFLNAYHGETVTLRLPERINVEDLEFLTIWSKFGARDFGFITFPKDVYIPGDEDEEREPKEIEEKEDEDDYLIPLPSWNIDEYTYNGGEYEMTEVYDNTGDEEYNDDLEEDITVLEKKLVEMKKELNERSHPLPESEDVIIAGSMPRTSSFPLLTLGLVLLISASM